MSNPFELDGYGGRNSYCESEFNYFEQPNKKEDHLISSKIMNNKSSEKSGKNKNISNNNSFSNNTDIFNNRNIDNNLKIIVNNEILNSKEEKKFLNIKRKSASNNHNDSNTEI